MAVLNTASDNLSVIAMTHLRQLCCFILLLLGAVASGLCADTVAPVDPASMRVVSQTVGTDELLLALAEPSQIAALSHLSRDARWSAVSVEAARYTQLSGTSDAESVLALRPTLVLCADYSRAELVSQLRKAGLHVVVFTRYSSLEDAYANLRLLAAELGPRAVVRCEALIARCEARVAALSARLSKLPRVRVLAPSVFGLIPGDGTTFQDLCDHAGAENLATTLGRLRGHEAPPSERMITWPVEKLVVAGENLEKALAPFRATPPYHFMPAVREGRAVLVPNYILSCLSHHRVECYEILALALHPELSAAEQAPNPKP
jgi:iron complex transport system substrate-binding protein